MPPTYDTSSGLRALQGGSLVADIDAGFLALAQDARDLIFHDSAVGSTPLVTSSATPADIAGAAITVDPAAGAMVEFGFACTFTPSATGIARVNLSINGVDAGQVLSAPAGAGQVFKFGVPGSADGNAFFGGMFAMLASPGAPYVIKLRGSSAAGSATFSVGVILVRNLK